MSNSTQICATVSNIIATEVLEIAKRDNRTFSQTVSLLLQRALHERNRKRKNVKENNT